MGNGLENKLGGKLEDRLEESLKIIKRYFPERESPEIDPHIRTEHSKGNDSNIGGYYLTKIWYNKAAFKEPINISDFSFAFKTFYVLTTLTKPNIGEKANSHSVRISISKENSRVIAYLDTEKGYMYFAYKREDIDTQKIISAFTKKLIWDK
nr:hypothetical protein [Nanoarchaeota archaeon]